MRDFCEEHMSLGNILLFACGTASQWNNRNSQCSIGEQLVGSQRAFNYKAWRMLDPIKLASINRRAAQL